MPEDELVPDQAVLKIDKTWPLNHFLYDEKIREGIDSECSALLEKIKSKRGGESPDPTDPETQKIVEERIVELFTPSSTNSDWYKNKPKILEILDKFPVSLNFIYSEKGKDLLLHKVVRDIMYNPLLGQALHIAKTLGYSEEEIKKLAVDVIENIMMNCGNGAEVLDEAEKVAQVFEISQDEINRLARHRFVWEKNLGRYHDDNNERAAQYLADKYGIEENEWVGLAKIEVAEECARTNTDDTTKYELILELAKTFNLTSDDLCDVLQGIETVVDNIRNLYPSLADKIRGSVQLAAMLVRYINNPERLLVSLKQHLFLQDIIDRNERFGPRLFVKFPDFDERSVQNIDLLFKLDGQVIDSDHVPDDKSGLYRSLMQVGLRRYERNPEIYDALVAKGINVDNWLSPKVEVANSFTMTKERGTSSFSQMIELPVTRIVDTMKLYTEAIRNNLSPDKEILQQSTVPPADFDELLAQKLKSEKALHAAEDAGDAKKIPGIKKGLANIEEKIASATPVTVWAKIESEISRIRSLGQDLILSVGALKKLENPKDSGELDGQASKVKLIKKAENGLKKNTVLFIDRFKQFETLTRENLETAVGGERAREVISKVQTELTEPINHFMFDTETLTTMFVGSEGQNVNRLDKTPIGIDVWSRNPNRDLFLGNYAPCCISIEAGGGEDDSHSAIADYMTDLGVQVVVSTDITRDLPVVASWCWLGEGKDGKTAMIIDNIEANTDYSAPYSDQISQKLIPYLIEYGKSTGVDRVELGLCNNDLPSPEFVAKYPKSKNTYTKIGGSNRQEGYYLESEGEPEEGDDNEMITLWEKI